MNPEERSMILDLFDRIGTAPQDNNDRDADRLIRDAVTRNPNAPYVLVQTVLLQEEALRRADERIRQLQDAAQPNADPGGSSFLGSARRAGQSSWGGSVPNAGVRQSVDDARYGQRTQAQQMQPPSQPVPPPGGGFGGGGGFLSSALSTAGGVAGGMLLADGIRGLFGGSHGSDIWGRTTESQPSPSDTNKADSAAQDRAQDAQQDADDDQDAVQDADDDSQDDIGWDDSDSMDA